MELRVQVDGIEQVVCGLNLTTTCQEIVFALAHATQQAGTFVLIERWGDSERLLPPYEQPLVTLQRWPDRNHEVEYILRKTNPYQSPSIQETSSTQQPTTSSTPMTNSHLDHHHHHHNQQQPQASYQHYLQPQPQQQHHNHHLQPQQNHHYQQRYLQAQVSSSPTQSLPLQSGLNQINQPILQTNIFEASQTMPQTSSYPQTTIRSEFTNPQSQLSNSIQQQQQQVHNQQQQQHTSPSSQAYLDMLAKIEEQKKVLINQKNELERLDNGNCNATPPEHSEYINRIKEEIKQLEELWHGNQKQIKKKQETIQIKQLTDNRHQDFIDLKTSSSLNGNLNMPQDWLDNICHHLIDHLNQFGICVIDNFLGSSKGNLILKEVEQLYLNGQYVKGRVVNNKIVTSRTLGNGDVSVIRNDRVIWVEGYEDGCSEINNLIQTLCSVVTNSSRLSLYSNNGLDKIVINKRTKAHVACYPGNGTRYIKHVDNPNNDGRVITSIYYLNKDWNTKRDGGLLRMFPAGMSEVANIEPLFDRVLFFWSDRRNPHEVLPAYKDRFAITVWYIGENRPENRVE